MSRVFTAEVIRLYCKPTFCIWKTLLRDLPEIDWLALIIFRNQACLSTILWKTHKRAALRIPQNFSHAIKVYITAFFYKRKTNYGLVHCNIYLQQKGFYEPLNDPRRKVHSFRQQEFSIINRFIKYNIKKKNKHFFNMQSSCYN